jgi:hypothetical protein
MGKNGERSMLKKIRTQSFYGVASLVILLVAMLGYNVIAEESRVPPRLGISGITEPLANVWVSPGITDHLGVYVGTGFLVMNVPDPGVYLLTYTTKTGGPFYLVFRVKANVLVFVGLPDDAEIVGAVLEEGDLTDLAETSPEIQDFGLITVFYRPGAIGRWSNFIVINPTIVNIVLVQAGVVIVSDNVIILTELELTNTTKCTTKTTKTTKKTKKTKKSKKK